MTEPELAVEFSVSRSVIREALLVLEHQGLIVSSPYKGSAVASISLEDVAGLLIPMRIQIERYALQIGMHRWDSRHFKRFDDVITRMEKAVAFGDVVAFNDADITFHALIIEGADSDTVRSVWEGINQRIRMHLALQTGRAGAPHQYLDDHRALLSVFRSGDLDASMTAAENHIRDTNVPLLSLLQNPVKDGGAHTNS